MSVEFRRRGPGEYVTSSGSLEPLIQKYDLYKTERERKEPMECSSTTCVKALTSR